MTHLNVDFDKTSVMIPMLCHALFNMGFAVGWTAVRVVHCSLLL